MRIWECRKSEGLSVIERIRIETSSYPATAGGRLLRGLSLSNFVRKLKILEANRICSISANMLQTILRNSEIITVSKAKITEVILVSWYLMQLIPFERLEPYEVKVSREEFTIRKVSVFFSGKSNH